MINYIKNSSYLSIKRIVCGVIRYTVQNINAQERIRNKV